MPRFSLQMIRNVFAPMNIQRLTSEVAM